MIGSTCITKLVKYNYNDDLHMFEMKLNHRNMHIYWMCLHGYLMHCFYVIFIILHILAIFLSTYLLNLKVWVNYTGVDTVLATLVITILVIYQRSSISHPSVKFASNSRNQSSRLIIKIFDRSDWSDGSDRLTFLTDGTRLGHMLNSYKLVSFVLIKMAPRENSNCSSTEARHFIINQSEKKSWEEKYADTTKFRYY